MASPFPGMDPYLESSAFWSDFHLRFLNSWDEAIADALPADYESSLGERVYLLEHEPDGRRLIYPDIAVMETERTSARTVGPRAAATLEPVSIPLEILEGPRETYIEILHRPDHRLVTVLELLSPANKHAPGRFEYLAKRQALLYQQVNLVELDLLHSGQRPPLRRPLPPDDYYYLLTRAGQVRCDVYHWSLCDLLPALPVPLRPPDDDIVIDLGSVFRTAYERGRFDRRIDRSESLPAALDEEMQRRVSQWLANVRNDPSPPQSP